MKVNNLEKEKANFTQEKTLFRCLAESFLQTQGVLVWMPKCESSAEAAQNRIGNCAKVFPYWLRD